MTPPPPPPAVLALTPGHVAGPPFYQPPLQDGYLNDQALLPNPDGIGGAQLLPPGYTGDISDPMLGTLYPPFPLGPPLPETVPVGLPIPLQMAQPEYQTYPLGLGIDAIPVARTTRPLRATLVSSRSLLAWTKPFPT